MTGKSRHGGRPYSHGLSRKRGKRGPGERGGVEGHPPLLFTTWADGKGKKERIAPLVILSERRGKTATWCGNISLISDAGGRIGFQKRGRKKKEVVKIEVTRAPFQPQRKSRKEPVLRLLKRPEGLRFPLPHIEGSARSLSS